MGDEKEYPQAILHLTMIFVAIPLIATDIHLRWQRMVAWLKTHNPGHQLRWSAADYVADNEIFSE